MSAASDLSRVRQPLAIGGTTIRNRIVLPAMTTNFGENHLPSVQHAAYHEERAAGGVGLIIFESIRVHRNSLGRPQAVNGYDPACIEPFREVTRRVHKHDTRILGQVIHLGRQVDGDFEGTVSWGASPVAWTATGVAPHEMTRADMDEVLTGHIVTARNLMAAGFDGIELQMAHGHLLQQFISPLSNRRADEYGGSLENRLRFPAEVLAALRAEVGSDFVLGIRLGAAEFVAGGLELPEARWVAVALTGQTQVDFVNVSHSAYHGSPSLGTQIADMSIDDVTGFRELPRGIRGALREAGRTTPVFAVCRFTSLDAAEEALRDGVADAVAMARAHLADPEIVTKTLHGRVDEVRRCIGCNQGCAGMLEKNLPVRCLVNPRAGREALADWRTEPSARPKRILIVGAGPAGMECAAVSARRGHEVHLWERADTVGGALAHAPRLPRRQEFHHLLDYQRRALSDARVEVTLGTEATVETVADFAADQVVLATGATMVVPEVPGGGSVLGLVETLDTLEALGHRVAVEDHTGEWAAVSLVEHLADRGHQVTLYSPVSAFAWRTTMYSTLATAGRLKSKKVRIRTLTGVASWDGRVLELVDQSTGEALPPAEYDALVRVVHPVTDNKFLLRLREDGFQASQIGDALAPRTALEAVHQGHRMGLDL